MPKGILMFLFKGSYTLEAAVIIPVAAVFFLTLLFFFRVLQIQTEVQEALNYASRKTACEASAVSSQTGLLVSAEAYFRKELGTYSLPENIFAVENMRLRWRNPICQEIILICRLIITLKFQLAF